MNINRRVFLKSGGIAMLGMTALPTFLRRAVAATPSRNKKILVVFFQRGAVDGLNVVVPFGERAYYQMRPSIAIPDPKGGTGDGMIDLDGFFGLHPSLAPLSTLYQKGQFAVVHATGSPDPSRSHFDAQDYMESGTPGVKTTDEGWLNRALQVQPDPKATPFRAVAVSPNLPLTLRGAAPAVAVPDVHAFRMFGPPQVTEAGFESLYADSVDKVLRGVGQETFQAMDTLKKIDPGKYRPENGADYPHSRFGQSLLEVAQLIKSDIGVEVAFVDSGGWDHHVNEGGAHGQLADLLRDLGQGLAALHQDLGDRMENVVFVSMSEFGRTAHENGNRGTDHGHGNYMFVMGGPVKGGKVYGRWPGLGPEQLNEGRDLKVTTDYRTVLSEVISRHLRATDLKKIFPGFDSDARNFLGLLKA